jgi:endonuclease YncB( thermonuclease family)
LLGNAAVIALSIGDTIRVSSSSGINKTTVRLACIDVPETSQAPYGNYQTSTGAIWYCFC